MSIESFPETFASLVALQELEKIKKARERLSRFSNAGLDVISAAAIQFAGEIVDFFPDDPYIARDYFDDFESGNLTNCYGATMLLFALTAPSERDQEKPFLPVKPAIVSSEKHWSFTLSDNQGALVIDSHYVDGKELDEEYRRLRIYKPTDGRFRAGYPPKDTRRIKNTILAETAYDIREHQSHEIKFSRPIIKGTQKTDILKAEGTDLVINTLALSTGAFAKQRIQQKIVTDSELCII